MVIVVLFFTILFAISAVIVTRVLINMRERKCKAEEEQHRKAEQDAKQRAKEKEWQQLEEKRRKAEEKHKHLEEEPQRRIEEETRSKVDEEQKRLTDELRKVEEESKRIEEEAQRKVQEEQRRKAEKEAREIAEKEELRRLEVERQQDEEERRKAEDEHRKAEGARKRAEKESRQKKEEVRGGERLSPGKRGGRPRGSTNRHEIEQTPGTKLRALKPEIICWNEGWRWTVGIEVPEEVETLSVAQNEELLEQDNTDESRYRLKHAQGAVKVTWTGGEKDIPLVEAGRNYFIFKMRKDWKGLGRLVKHPTTGYYLAIIPQEWKRNKGVSGTTPISPGNIQLDGYEAHFFYLEKSMVMGFITVNGERIRIESGDPIFQLVGRKIDDASEEMGPLFSEQPPCIKALDEKRWSDIGVVVVGEEGGGRNKWRTQFFPQVGVKEQKLPEELANRRGGWYFVRIYDNGDNLLESMDFRFLMALEDIRMGSFDYLPGANGHDNVVVQFLHQTDCKVKLVDKDTQQALEVQREDGQTIVTIPPKPDCDKTHWILGSGDAKVEATVLVERIWWAFGTTGGVPIDWVDKPVTLSRKDFTAITDKALWVRLPRLRFLRKIDVGFDRRKSRSYQVEVEKKEIAIPLRDFCDAEEIEKRQVELGMKIWVHSEEAKSNEGVIARVPSEQPPAIEPKQRKILKPITEEEKNNFSQAIVKCRRGKRKGKGFSKKELTEAGIKIKDVKLLNISYDKRRKTSHSWNVESLNI